MKWAFAIVVCLLLTGCVSSYSLFGGNSGSNPNGSWMHRIFSSGNTPANTKPDNIKPASFKERVSEVLHKNTGVACLAAVVFMLWAGVSFWREHYFCALKLMLAAFSFPICAIFFELFWAWIISAILVVVVIVAFVHYKMVICPKNK